MQRAETILWVIHESSRSEETGEPDALKGACPVRRGAGGKGLLMRHLACGLPNYALSYRDLEEIMQERGLAVDHSTVSDCVKTNWSSSVS